MKNSDNHIIEAAFGQLSFIASMQDQKNADSMFKLKMRCGGIGLFRLSMIRNYPVIFRNKRVGLLLGMRSDLHTKRITDLIVSCGFRGKRMIQSNCVDTIADGFILLRDMHLCSPRQECTGTDFVYDTTGLFVGRIMDIVAEESSMTIQALDVCTGYLPGIFSKRIWVFEFEQKSHGEVVIPASFGNGLIEWVKEEKTCV